MMKKWSIAVMALAVGLYATAQETGMHFEHGGTWEQALAKAKAENKYIFIDCYTTWCGPCKQMSKNIFPTAAVGDYYNKNFINLKLQIDTLRDKDKKITDSKEVQDWYATADLLEARYNIKAYPTYLFFDPNGQIVHRAVGSYEADKFISKGKEALVPEQQYYTLKRKYEAGDRNEKFLYMMANAANESYDPPFSRSVVNEYLSTQKDLLTKENVAFIAENTVTSQDKGFKALMDNPEAFDKEYGQPFANFTIRMILLREDVLPILFPPDNKENMAPDWNTALKKVSEKYPKYGTEAVAFYKTDYYRQHGDWKNFGTAISDYMKAHGSNASPSQINSFAWAIFENCNDAACISSALDWSKKPLTTEENPGFIDTYANLLYKAGKKKEAVEWETRAVGIVEKKKENAGGYKETLNKMNRGEKTW